MNFKEIKRFIKNNNMLCTGLFIFLLLVIMSVFAPLIAP